MNLLTTPTAPELVFFTFATYGLCHIVMHGEILDAPRAILSRVAFFSSLLSCALCTGFWSGVVMIPFTQNALYPLYSACVCYFLHLLQEWLTDQVYPVDDLVD